MSPRNKIETEMFYVIKFVKILDLFPNKSTKTYQKLFYCFMHKLLIIISLIFAYKYVYILTLVNVVNGIISKITFAVILSLLFFTLCSNLYTLIYCKKDMVQLWQNIIQLEELCNKLKLKPKSEKYTNFLLSLTPLLIRLAYDYISYNGEINIIWLMMISMQLLRFIFRLHYLALIALLKNYFKQLNDLIETTPNLHWRNAVRLLKRIAICHQQMYYLMKIINKIMTVQILTDIVKSASGLLFVLFLFINDYLNSTFSLIRFNQVLAVFKMIIMILISIIPVSNCRKYANQIQQTLLETASLIKNPDVLRHMKMLSLQLGCCNLEFSINGIIILDYKLLFSIICGISSNLVVLIQIAKL